MPATVAAPDPKHSPLSITELALLEMTSDESYLKSPSVPEHVLITNKDVYLWAALLATVVEHSRHIDAETFMRLCAGSIAEARQLLMDYYATWEPSQPQRIETKIADRIMSNILTNLQIPASIDDLRRSASGAYTQLLERGLIEDPIEIAVGAVAVAVLGLLPIGFTRRTKNGELVSQRIWGLFWAYEKSESRGAIDQKLEFRLLEFLRAFYKGAVGGFQSALSGTRPSRPSTK
jgi:hypothetical protein